MNKQWMVAIAVGSLLLLAGCGGGSSQSDSGQSTASQPAVASSQNSGGQGGNGQNNFGGGGFAPFQSAYLTNTYDSALPTTMQLQLGTMKLEEGNNKITPDQAKKLLPLWQGIQSGSIQNASERNAVYKSIEKAMTPEQMNEIVAMKLTFTSLTDWAKANGVDLPQNFGQGGFNQNGQGGPFANMSEDERTKLRQELQSMTPEQRQARLKELGINIPQDRQNGQGGQGGQRQGGRGGFLMTPLIKLLTDRSAQ
ncbi:MAG: hypothetical protein U0175_39715 [Caldilineaceae bacterium]